MSLNICLRTIPHSAQRYASIGDWLTPEEGFPDTTVVASDLGNDDYSFCILIHEVLEMYLCRKRGIKATDVTAFDKAFEANRAEEDCSEPGDSPLCPYYTEHQFATNIERQIIYELGVDWTHYEQVIEEVTNDGRTVAAVQQEDTGSRK